MISKSDLVEFKLVPAEHLASLSDLVNLEKFETSPHAQLAPENLAGIVEVLASLATRNGNLSHVILPILPGDGGSGVGVKSAENRRIFKPILDAGFRWVHDVFDSSVKDRKIGEEYYLPSLQRTRE